MNLYIIENLNASWDENIFHVVAANDENYVRSLAAAHVQKLESPKIWLNEETSTVRLIGTARADLSIPQIILTNTNWG